ACRPRPGNHRGTGLSRRCRTSTRWRPLTDPGEVPGTHEPVPATAERRGCVREPRSVHRSPPSPRCSRITAPPRGRKHRAGRTARTQGPTGDCPPWRVELLSTLVDQSASVPPSLRPVVLAKAGTFLLGSAIAGLVVRVVGRRTLEAPSRR